MSDIDVDLGVLSTIATTLDTAADGLEGLAGSVPRAVDAGPMTAVIASMLSQVVNSAGNVSTSLSSSAEMARLSRRYYERADADAATDLSGIRKVVDP
jgi:hypothetical protein